MRPPIPSSLAGQLALVMALSVLAAAAIQVVVLVLERNRTGLIEASGPAITRFADLTADALNRDLSELPDNQVRFLRRRGANVEISRDNAVETRGLPRTRQIERRLDRALEAIGHADVPIMAATRILDEQEVRRLRERGPEPRGFRLDNRAPRTLREIILAAEIAPGRWLSGAYLSPSPPNDDFSRIFFGLLIAIGCVLGAALWMSNRLVRPLGELATAASRFSGAAEPEMLEVRGPREVQRTLSAFNAMNGRVTDLLKEKDVMLGALGHDLRTPLASLRIRVESMEPESEREKAISTIEETARLLESILDFARTGRGNQGAQTVELGELLEALANDYKGQGHDISADTTTTDQSVHLNPDLLRRLLRNLIDNACQHAQKIRIEQSHADGFAAIAILDDGPGIPPEQLELVRQPFYRTEASRNRQHGGAGLGLALAETIVRTLGGRLDIANRPTGGLAATVYLPLNDTSAAPARD